MAIALQKVMTKYVVFALLAFHTSAYAADIFHIEAPGGSVAWKTKPKTVKADAALVKLEKKQCLPNPTGQCAVFSDSISGSAFLATDTDLILTTLHTFKSFLKIYWQQSPSASEIVTVPLVISKDGGDVVFGDQPGDEARLTLFYPQAQRYVMDDTISAYPDLDLVFIRLSRPIGEPLPLSSALTTVSQKVSLSGYSWLNTVQLVTVPGQVLQKSSFPGCAYNINSWNNIQTANYDHDPGLSGAPVLNEKGEVVGVHVGDCPAPTGPFRVFVPTAKLFSQN